MRWAFLVVGLILGVLSLGMARFAFVAPPPAVHHHANFAVFVDGQRLDLSGDRYMEDVTACAARFDVSPTAMQWRLYSFGSAPRPALEA